MFGVSKIQLRYIIKKLEKQAKEFNHIASPQGLEPNVYHHYSGIAKGYMDAARELKNLIGE